MVCVVEAAYVLDGDDQSWLQRVSDALQSVIAAPLGCLCYHGTLDPPGLELAAQSAGTFDMIAAIAKLAAAPDGAPAVDAMRLPVDRMLMSEMLPPGLVHLGLLPGGPEAGMVDALNVRAHHAEDDSVTMIGAALTELRPLSPRDRSRWLMVAAHVQSGLRLRRRLRNEGLLDRAEPAAGEAVFEPGGRVVHADGEARAPEALLALREAAQAVDAARATGSGRGDDALRIWRALVLGEWSVVDRFDSDGRRFLIAHKNPSTVRDPRGLTHQQARVALSAAQGLANKHIAYQLGVSESTISTHLSAAMRKLGMTSRSELVQALGWIERDPLASE